MNCKYDPLRAALTSSTATAELRGALGMLAVTDDYPPEQAWNEAIELVRVRMAALHDAALEWTQAPTSSEYGPTMREATIALSNDETLRLLADESAVHLVGLFLRPEIVQAATNDTPSAHALTVELREALGLFAGAMACSPQQAWDEAIQMIKNNRAALSAPAQDAQADLIGDCVASECAARTQPATPAQDAAATASRRQRQVADLRDAKWLDPRCADRGACQSLVFAQEPATPAAQPVAVTADDLIDIARRVEGLKRECGMNPESPIAIQNGRYMAISYALRDLAKRAAPTAPQAVPLTDAQIQELVDDDVFFGSATSIVRDIERAHGIGTTATKEQSK